MRPEITSAVRIVRRGSSFRGRDASVSVTDAPTLFVRLRSRRLRDLLISEVCAWRYGARWLGVCVKVLEVAPARQSRRALEGLPGHGDHVAGRVSPRRNVCPSRKPTVSGAQVPRARGLGREGTRQ